MNIIPGRRINSCFVAKIIKHILVGFTYINFCFTINPEFMSDKMILPEWGFCCLAQVHYGGDVGCPHCADFSRANLIKSGEEGRWFDAVIGFSVNKPLRNDAAVGSLVLKCPSCQENFWCHLLYTHINIYIVRVSVWSKPQQQSRSVL